MFSILFSRLFLRDSISLTFSKRLFVRFGMWLRVTCGFEIASFMASRTAFSILSALTGLALQSLGLDHLPCPKSFKIFSNRGFKLGISSLTVF